MASGSADPSSGERLLDRYDFAVLGTVTAIETPGEHDAGYPTTMVTFDVVAVLGHQEAPGTLELSSPDPGWLAGYPFKEGTAYFVPVQAEGPNGEPNYTFVCDPITETPSVEALATELSALAAQAGIPFATPLPDGPIDTTGLDDRDALGDASTAVPTPPSGAFTGASLLVGAMVATMITAGAMSARRRTTGTGPNHASRGGRSRRAGRRAMS